MGERHNPFLSAEDRALDAFASKVQAWSLTRQKTHGSYGTFGQAAEAMKVPVERIAEAVDWHYWMFSHDDGPLADREIDHDGE